MSASLPLPIEFVRTREGLARAAERWRGAPALAIDTEFVRERTFFPHLGLIQVADRTAATLVDPLAAGDLAPFAAVLDDPATIKVVHSASQDLEVFFRAFGRLPSSLFDTQEAAAIAGLGAGLGYGRLVALRLGVELEKGETRTDWLKRPLSAAQLAYAAADVAYLLPLYDDLRRELEAQGRFAWALEDSASLLDVRFDEEPDEAHRRIKGGGRFDRRQIAALRALAAWREREARQRDLPRNMVLKEEMLVELARRFPSDPAELRKLPGYLPAQVARDHSAWFAILRAVEALPGEELPPAPERRRPGPQVEALEEKLREKVKARAAELGLAPETLASRRPLAALARAIESPEEPKLPRELEGWRREVIGEELLALARRARR
ncbi:MAG TPA: ribonuclease D [Thermoanaerobaculia bacterium]|nr:ribonuclease D [Thermoanaerobaculia bacterium]